MADTKINFYIGTITEGGLDGEKCTSIQSLFPLVWVTGTQHSNSLYEENYARLPIKFALRCDDGYKATDVKLTFDRGEFKIGCLKNDYSDKFLNIQSVDLGTVNNTNKIVRLYSDFYPNNAIKIYVSYTEIKL